MSWLSSVGQWLGKNALGVANLAANGLSSWLGMRQQNANIDKQLAAQQVEQEKIRDYNYEMWRENNAYNSPMQQKARLEQAGLNADLMYGQGGVMNTASSPSPATPMDWSSLSNKRTVGDVVMQNLAIEQAKANIDKTRGEAKAQGVTNDVRQRMIDKGMIIEEAEYDLLREQINKVFEEARSIDYATTEVRVMSNFFDKYENEIVSNMLQRLHASTKMSENALKEDIETLTLRIAGMNAENSELVRLSGFNTDEKRLVFDIVKELLRVFITKKPPNLRK